MMMMLRLALFLSLLATASAFVVPSSSSSSSRTTTLLSALSCPAMPEGEREILDGPNGPILVTKVAGNFYAVDATCPHLGLPMKKGKIEVEGGVPTLTCNFHNSCFELQTGKCTKWVTGALGVKSGLLSGVMSKVGGQQADIKAYSVKQKEDGSLVIE